MKNKFTSALDSIDFSLKDIEKHSGKAKEAFLETNVDELDRNIDNVIKASEQLVNASRMLPYTIGLKVDELELEEKILDYSGVEVYLEGNVLNLELPLLLPRKKSGNATYIRTLVYLALQNYFKKHKPFQYEDHVVICINNQYHEFKSWLEYRDYDNIEIKAVIDAITAFVLKDDSSYHCDHYYYSSKGDQDKTIVSIIPLKDFPKCLEKRMGDESL